MSDTREIVTATGEFVAAKALQDAGLTPLQSWQHVFSNALEAAAEDLDERERHALAMDIFVRVRRELG